MTQQSHSRVYNLEKTIIPKETCTPMFTAALFTTAKIWKQPKCPLTDEWMKKIQCVNHTHTMAYYSVIIKNEIIPFSTIGMDLEIIILSEVRRRKTNTI